MGDLDHNMDILHDVYLVHVVDVIVLISLPMLESIFLVDYDDDDDWEWSLEYFYFLEDYLKIV